MASRNKLYYGLLVVVLVAIAVIVPVVTGKSWPALLDSALEQYNEAAEQAAQIGDDDDDDDDEAASSELEPMTVSLDEEALDFAGVETMPIREDLYFPEIKAYASVVDVRELIKWRSRLNQLESALRLAQVNERASRQEYERLKKLAAGTGSVASKNVNYAQAKWQEASANLQAARYQLDDAEIELKQGWGQVIADWVSHRDNSEFERLASREDSLLMVTMPVDERLPADVSVIRISREGDRKAARKAYYVSPAYVADKPTIGETYFFRTETGRLRLGMRLDAWIAQNDEPVRGFHIPEEAVVWYSGQAWTYVQEDQATYKRKSLAQADDVAGGMFIRSGFATGDKLVISGAQMLLSEEFRWQIQGEDDD
jgi:hypothetical protein